MSYERWERWEQFRSLPLLSLVSKFMMRAALLISLGILTSPACQSAVSVYCTDNRISLNIVIVIKLKDFSILLILQDNGE